MAASTLDLRLPARPESVAHARRRVRELANGLGLSESRADDLRTVVSEACMNAAVHAYDGDSPGEFEVSARPIDGEIEVTVSDRGSGIRPQAAGRPSAGSLGILVMARLAESLEIRTGPEGGTIVRLRLPALD